MKRLLSTSLLIAILGMGLTGCATYLPYGKYVVDTKAAKTVAEEKVDCSKTGVAMAKSYLGIVATGDASLEAAMKNGGITKVKHVEYAVRNVLGFYGEYKTIVYGD